MSRISQAMRHLFYIELTGGDEVSGDLVARLLVSGAALNSAASEQAVRAALSALLKDPWHISHLRKISGCDSDVMELLYYDETVPGLMTANNELNLPALIGALSKVGSKGDLQEFFPGATAEEVGSVMMQDIVGDHDTPDQVPEWTWVEQHASFNHRGNGKEPGVWEFVLNLDNGLNDVPSKLVNVLAEARSKGLSYLVFHQGS